jgi:hypothetical protein
VRQYVRNIITDGQVFVSLDDFNRRFGVGRTKAYELIGAGAIEAVKVGRRTLIVLDSALRWAASLPKYAPKARQDGCGND